MVSNLTKEHVEYKLKIFRNDWVLYSEKNVVDEQHTTGDTTESMLARDGIRVGDELTVTIGARGRTYREQFTLSCGPAEEGAFLTGRIHDDYVSINTSDCS
jgi:hypothetical protein